MTLFKLYWFDTRNGDGFPAIAYPEAMTYEQAALMVKGKDGFGKKRHPKDSRKELHYEPAELHEKYTVKNPPI